MPNNFLTKEGYQKLQDELDYLRTAKRQEVANRLHEAMEGGELIENAEYEAAKNEQAFVEGRIQELEMLLATARIIEENGKKKSDMVQIGSKVTIKEGSFEDVDLTLLAVEKDLLPMSLRLRRTSLCKAPPSPGEEVITIVPEAAVHSHVISPQRLPPDVRRFNTVIGDVAKTGNSGAGVFDAKQRCLLGIMSRKISTTQFHPETGKTEVHDIAKYFVPSPTIAAFMPPDLHW